MKQIEARQLVEEAYARADQTKQASLGISKASLLMPLLGSGVGAGLGLLGSEFVGDGGETDPEMAKLKARRRRLQAALGGAAVGGLGGLGLASVDALGGNQATKTDRNAGLRKGLFWTGAGLMGGSAAFHPLLKGTRITRDAIVPPVPGDIRNSPLFRPKKRLLNEGWEHSKTMNRIRAGSAAAGAAMMLGSRYLPRGKEGQVKLADLCGGGTKTAWASQAVKWMGSQAGKFMGSQAGNFLKDKAIGFAKDQAVGFAKDQIGGFVKDRVMDVGRGIGNAYSALTYGPAQQDYVNSMIPDSAYAASY